MDELWLKFGKKFDDLFPRQKVEGLLSNVGVHTLVSIILFRPVLISDLIKYTDIKLFIIINDFFKILSVIIFLIIFLLFIRYGALNNLIITIFLMYLFLFLSTILSNSGNISRFVGNSIGPITLLMMLNLLHNFEFLDNYNYSLFYFLTFMIITNFIIVLLKPTGLYVDERQKDGIFFLFGNYQQNVNYYLMYFGTLSCLDDTRLHANRKIIGVTVLSIVFTTILNWSATTIITLSVLLLLFMLLIKFPLLLNYFNPFGAFIFGVLVTTLMVYANIQNWFKFIIVDLLKKSVTLTNRVQAWNRSIELFKIRPIFGFGFQLSERVRHNMGFSSAHNQFLHSLYMGGIIYVLYQLLISYLLTKMIKYKEKNHGLLLLAATIFSYNIYFISETKINLINYLYLIIILSYYPNSKGGTENCFIESR